MVEAKPAKLNAGNWESLGKHEPACAQCATVFAEGDEFVSSITFAEDGLVRADRCPKCFEQTGGDSFAFWRARLQSPDRRRPRALDLNFLTEFFERLTDTPEPQSAEVTYIVALLLIRRKIFVQVRTERDGEVEYLVVARKGEDTPERRLVAPELTPAKMETIRDDLGRIFNLDDGPADAAESPVAV